MKQLYPTRHSLLNQSQDVIHELAVDKNIALVWIPGQRSHQFTNTVRSQAEMISNRKSKEKALEIWQNQWEAIKVFNRRAEVVITSMRIGHTHLTYSYHLEPPHCDTTLTVPHILHDCGLFIVGRAKYGKN
jgi:hypothetical protein